MTATRAPTPAMLAVGRAVIERVVDRWIPVTLMELAWVAMWDAAMEKPAWSESFDGLLLFIRSDGATVHHVETKTGKRPWRGSHWQSGEWKMNFNNTATVKAAMDAIDFHWPKAMEP